MYGRITLAEYFALDETTRPQELAHGILREPPAPTFSHQIVVGRIFVRLDRYVQRADVGRVVQSPVDVVLDRENALVVQPDLVFVSKARLAICTDRVWGSPDLTVEVLSTATRRRDRGTKLEWYRKYDVRECWLVDPIALTVEVVDLGAAKGTSRTFEGSQIVRSSVLPRLRMPALDAFEKRR